MSSPGFRLRPFNVTDLIDESLRLYRQNFRLFISIGLPLIIPWALLQLATQLALRQPWSTEPTLPFSNSFLPGSRIAIEPSDDLLLGLLLLGGLGLLAALVEFVIFLATTYAAAEAVMGRRVTVGGAYRAILRRTGSIAWVGLLYGLAVGALTIMILPIPVAIFFYFAWWFAFHAVLLEGKSGGDALGRSRALVRGNWWRVFGVAILITIISQIVEGVFSLVTTPLGFASFQDDASSLLVAFSAVANVATTAAATLIVGPMAICSRLLLYYDLRVRKEGLDLELQAREMMASAQPAGSLD